MSASCLHISIGTFYKTFYTLVDIAAFIWKSINCNVGKVAKSHETSEKFQTEKIMLMELYIQSHFPCLSYKNVTKIRATLENECYRFFVKIHPTSHLSFYCWLMFKRKNLPFCGCFKSTNGKTDPNYQVCDEEPKCMNIIIVFLLTTTTTANHVSHNPHKLH